MAFGIVFSLDYEIHGNGAGSPMELMVEPTWRLLRQLERFGGKLTIFAEAMEILRFREHFRATGRDDFAYEAIAEQLRYAVAHGHDVQLHIHPSYANAVLEDGRWRQDWSEYDTALLPPARIRAVLREAAGLLDDILKPVQPDYTMYAFRAGNWAMMPTRNIADALIERGILVDSSVFKGGRRNDVARFDYSGAHSALLPWRAKRDDINQVDPSSPLWEFPIYCEMRRSGPSSAPTASTGSSRRAPTAWATRKPRQQGKARRGPACCRGLQRRCSASTPGRPISTNARGPSSSPR